MVIPDNWHKNSDGSYDVDGNVMLSKCYVSCGKLRIKFRRVTGDFRCDRLNLLILLGCPAEVGGTFSCVANKLTTLEGGPLSVGKSYICSNNQLGTLLGSPKEINGDFSCDHNLLKLLSHAPSRVKGSFNCGYNYIFSLNGGPKIVGKDYKCSFNILEDLQGAPKKLYGDFICNANKLSSLKGCPSRVYGAFNCEHNKLKYFEGVKGITSLHITHNPMKKFNAIYFQPLLNAYSEMCDYDYQQDEIRKLFTGIQINWEGFRDSLAKYINWLPKGLSVTHINLTSKQQKELQAIQISQL